MATMNRATQPLHFHPRSPIPSDAAYIADDGTAVTFQNAAAKFRMLSADSYVAISPSGDHLFLSAAEAAQLHANAPADEAKLAHRQALFFTASPHIGRGSRRLLKSRQAAKRATVDSGASLHILVPTLQCAHSCQYCQVSRSLDDVGHTMSEADLDAACDAIFLSPSRTLTVEFQGGDPLLRFDLVTRAVLRITARNRDEGRAIRFVVASTLHQLDETMCRFFRAHSVYLSTSIDGPAPLHNRNRPTPGRDAHQRTVEGIILARELIGADSVSALMTTTRFSLGFADAIVDEYVRLGFSEIFIRPLSSYGFAKRNQQRMGYSVDEFMAFFDKALERVLWWNDNGTPIREAYSTILFNKMLSTFDAGYVDLQSPTGAGSSVLVYNYDGYVYPSDEARMLAEDGDVQLRLGSIDSLDGTLSSHPVLQDLQRASMPGLVAGCASCAYHQFCGANPVDAHAQHGDMFAPVLSTEHCQRHLRLFDTMYRRLRDAADKERDLYFDWARPARRQDVQCVG